LPEGEDGMAGMASRNIGLMGPEECGIIKRNSSAAIFNVPLFQHAIVSEDPI
jgi:hypothetical protein